MKWHNRTLVSLGVAVTFFVVTALALTILDLYRTGHGLDSFNQATISVPGFAYPFSPNDLVLIASFILPGLGAWLLSGRGTRRAT